jgi:hypothetical protein
MSCCVGCQSGMGCCGSSDLAGLYGLSGLNGLNGLMGDLLAPGSQARVGFAFNYSLAWDADETAAMGAGSIQSAIYNQLASLGVFSSISVTVNPMPAFLSDGYILVYATAKDGQSNPENIGDMVQYAIQQYVPRVLITRRDPVKIDYVPPEAQGKAGVAQPSQTQQLPQSQPGQCNWDTQSFGDYVACQLGISSPIGGVGVGAVGALVAVGIGTLILVAVLKR